MAKVFFTSDPHLGHKNLVEGLRNMSVEECDNLIISNWNRVVSKRDRVYVLGDLVMEKHNILKNYIPKLNGTIVVSPGNHCTKRVCQEYHNLGIIVVGSLEYKDFILTHIPIHEACLAEYRGNIHGHIHIPGLLNNECINNPKYYNVNTELHDYTPVEFNKILEYYEKVSHEY